MKTCFSRGIIVSIMTMIKMIIILVNIVMIRMEDGPRWMHAFQFYSSFTRVEMAYQARPNYPMSDDDDDGDYGDDDDDDCCW